MKKRLILKKAGINKVFFVGAFSTHDRNLRWFRWCNKILPF